MLLITRPRSGTAGVLCEVLRETKERLYVRVVRYPNDRDWCDSFVSGTRGNQYVDKGAVLVRGITEHEYQAYLNIWDYYTGEIEALRKEHTQEMNERLAQRAEMVAAVFAIVRTN